MLSGFVSVWSEKESGNGQWWALHNIVSVINGTELYASKWLKWSNFMLCFKNHHKKLLRVSSTVIRTQRAKLIIAYWVLKQTLLRIYWALSVYQPLWYMFSVGYHNLLHSLIICGLALVSAHLKKQCFQNGFSRESQSACPQILAGPLVVFMGWLAARLLRWASLVPGPVGEETWCFGPQ